MAYDVHIFRGRNWWEGTDKPITEEEILAVNGVKRISEVSEKAKNNIDNCLNYTFDRYTYMDFNFTNKKAADII